MKGAGYAVAASLGGLAVAMVGAQAPPPPMPAWIAGYCADASPCTAPQVVNGIAFQQVALELDGTACPPPVAPGDIWSACVGPASGAHWLLLTRGDVHHGGEAIDHDVVFASTLPIYGPGGPPGSPLNLRGLPIGFGAVVSLGLPPSGAPIQAAQFPAPSPVATQAWFVTAYAECVAMGDCPTAGLPTPAEFAILCAADPQCSQDDDHVHDTAASTTGTGRD